MPKSKLTSSESPLQIGNVPYPALPRQNQYYNSVKTMVTRRNSRYTPLMFNVSLIALATLLFPHYSWAIIESADDLRMVADRIDTIVIGGIRTLDSTAQEKGWKISGPHCLTVNIDPLSNPDFIADAYRDDLNEKLRPIFEVFGPDRSHFRRIRKVIYEHVGFCLPLNKELALLLSSGGTYECSSFWSKLYERNHRWRQKLDRQMLDLAQALGFDDPENKPLKRLKREDQELDVPEFSEKILDSVNQSESRRYVVDLKTREVISQKLPTLRK